MKSILYLLIILLITFSCVKFDGEIPINYRQQFNHYTLNDTIFFISDYNDLDTIVIKSMDSISEIHNGITTLPYKKIVLRAEYLPKNKWFDGIILSEKTKKYDSIKNHSFIWLFKDIQSKKSLYEIGISYRNFEGNIDLEKLESKGIDTIKNSSYLRDSLNLDFVIEVYWSKEKGMIGYKKKDGQVYEVRRLDRSDLSPQR